VLLVRRKQALRRTKDGTQPAAVHYEAFGRVMAALATEADFIEACRDLTWWRGAGPSWHVEWRDGPFAAEAAALLADRMPGLVTPGESGDSCAVLDVMGVRFELRAIDPMGRVRVRARPDFWRLAEALDTTRPTNTRHPWEELLGG